MNEDQYLTQGAFVSLYGREHTDMNIIAALSVRTFAVKLAEGRGIVVRSKKVDRAGRESKTITLPRSIWGEAYNKTVI